MKKVVLISLLLILVLLMLILPNYPALHYVFNQQTTISNADVTIENSNSLLGDISYLSAISKRTSDIKKNNETSTPPKPNKEITSFVYLLSSLYLNLNVEIGNIKYFVFSELLFKIFIPLNNPPPKYLIIYNR
jgi:hypothetical protein